MSTGTNGHPTMDTKGRRRPDAQWWRRYDDVVGMNARNAHIADVNPPEAIRLVNDKAATKACLTAVGIPVAPTLELIDDGHFARRLRPDDLPDEWVMKPNQGLGGTGILIASGRTGHGWKRMSGSSLDVLVVKDHLRFILDGEFSGRARDKALIEPLLTSHPDFGRLAHRGLPDVRVICTGDEPKLAMARLPTSASGGRANLHQRAVGAAVDIGTGTISAARVGRMPMPAHPDTGVRLVGAPIPCWTEILEAASRCAGATGLGYVGADIIIDRERGPLVLEVNARPGLQIQNVSAGGIRALLDHTIHQVAP